MLSRPPRALAPVSSPPSGSATLSGRKMSRITGFYRSSLGKKAVMAVTGLALFGFILAHLFGNLKLYQGEAAFDAYAEHLREIGAPIFAHGQVLWILRLGLLAAVGLHIHAAWALTMQNRRARPTGYEAESHLQSTYASRTMRWGGVLILLFVI